MAGFLQTLFESLVPNQAGALLIGLVVFFLVAGDHRRLRSRRNLVVLCLYGMAPLFLNVLEWEERLGSKLGDLGGKTVFLGIFAYTAFFAAWAFGLSRLEGASDFRPSVPAPALRLLALVLVSANAVAALGRDPDDCGIYTNLGARRWVETGTLPYGDPMLRGPDAPGYGAAATYGPLLYAAHVPVQLALGVPVNPSDANPMQPTYEWPPVLASQIVCALFQIAGCLALFFLGKRLAGEAVGLAVVCLYAGSPFVFGLGDDGLVIGGMAFISHMVPSAAVLLALAAHRKPVLAGILLAIGAGLLFYPAFLFPAWLGWYLWGKRGAGRFLAGFAGCGLAILLLVILGTHTEPGENAVSLFLKSTLEHQEGVGAKEYGASRFSFWGMWPGMAEIFQRPIVGSGSLFKPTFLLFASLSIGSFFLARGRDLARLIALSAMIAAAVQLWKTHATGSYVEWYFPLLLLALFARPGLDEYGDEHGDGELTDLDSYAEGAG